MGGAIVRKLFKSVIQKSQQVSTPVAPAVSQITPVAETNARKTLASSGYGSSSIMTSSQGLEEEANVSKTVLGGAVKKKKY